LLRKQRKALGGYFILPHLVYSHSCSSSSEVWMCMYGTDQ